MSPMYKNVFRTLLFSIAFQWFKVSSEEETKVTSVDGIVFQRHHRFSAVENSANVWTSDSLIWDSVFGNKSFYDEDPAGTDSPELREGRANKKKSNPAQKIGSGISLVHKKKKKKKKKRTKLKLKKTEKYLALFLEWAKLKFSKYMFSLLVAFKMKFLAIFPVLATGLFLVVGSAGMAGFFFALFMASLGLKGWSNP